MAASDSEQLTNRLESVSELQEVEDPSDKGALVKPSLREQAAKISERIASQKERVEAEESTSVPVAKDADKVAKSTSSSSRS